MPRRTDIISRSPSHPSGGEGWGEGVLGVSPERDQYFSDNSRQVPHHILIAESDHAIAKSFENSGPRHVICLTTGVSIPVKFNDETLRTSCKVCNIGRQHDLSLKLCTNPVGTNSIPQPSFRSSEIRAQPFRADARVDMPFQFAPSPFPLPLMGERDSVSRHSINSIHGIHLVNA